MDGRKRTVQLKFRVTEAERDLILEKMKLIPTRNMAAYLRKIAIDGYIIQIDHSDITGCGCGGSTVSVAACLVPIASISTFSGSRCAGCG